MLFKPESEKMKLPIGVIVNATGINGTVRLRPDLMEACCLLDA